MTRRYGWTRGPAIGCRPHLHPTAPPVEHVGQVAPASAGNQHVQPVARTDDRAAAWWDRRAAPLDDGDEGRPRQSQLAHRGTVDRMVVLHGEVDEVELVERAHFDRRVS